MAEKEAIKAAQKLYRQSCKKLVELCTEKMPGTNYDRFYCETLVKKYPKQEQLDGLIEKMAAIEADSVDAFIEQFKLLVDADAAKKEEERKKQEEEKKASATTGGSGKAVKEWPQEDIAKLTLAINKFPAGTSQRW